MDSHPLTGAGEDGRPLPGDPLSGGEGAILAADFGGSKIAVAVSDLSGKISARRVVSTDPAAGAESNFELAVEAAASLLKGAAVSAVGACTFGIPREDRIELAPAITGWEKLALARLLEAAFDAPARVVTDVKAAAMVEARRGALQGADPSLYLNLGTGLAVAVVSGGEVVQGAHGAAGEIGYNLPRGGTAPPLLEEVVSGMALAAALRRRGHEPGDVAPVVLILREGGADPSYRAIWEEFLEELCFHMVNLAIALDPERIAVGGGMVRSFSHIARPLEQALLERVPFPPQLVAAAFPYDGALLGALEIGLELARSIEAERYLGKRTSALT